VLLFITFTANLFFIIFLESHVKTVEYDPSPILKILS